MTHQLPIAFHARSCYVVVHHPGNMQGYGGAVGNYIALINFPTPSCVPAQSPCG